MLRRRRLSIAASFVVLVACSTETSTPETAAPASGAPSSEEDATVPPEEEAPKTHVVSVTSDAFTPEKLTLRVGDTVEWAWKEGQHSVTSGDNCSPDGDFDSASRRAPYKYRRTFEAAGRVVYHCKVGNHCTGSGQIGVIEVMD
jgi:plastocyanin